MAENVGFRGELQTKLLNRIPSLLTPNTTLNDVIFDPRTVITHSTAYADVTDYTFLLVNKSIRVRLIDYFNEGVPASMVEMTFMLPQTNPFNVGYGGKVGNDDNLSRISVLGSDRYGNPATSQSLVINRIAKTAKMEGRDGAKSLVTWRNFSQIPKESVELNSIRNHPNGPLKLYNLEGLSDRHSKTFGFYPEGHDGFPSMPVVLPKKLRVLRK